MGSQTRSRRVRFAGCFLRAYGRRGSAILELALSIPLLAAILAGAMDFSRLFYTSVTLAGAARAGAQYALSVGYSDLAALQAAASNAAGDLGGVTATAVVTTRCPADCASGSATYIDVSVSKNFQTMVNYVFLPSSVAATQTVSMRVR